MIKHLCVLAALSVAWASLANAGVFTIPQFVEHHSWAFGFEPEATLETAGGGSGVAMNTKFTYGITPLSNLQVGIGPGSGEKTFRVGGAYSFDIIPDLPGQVGAGLAAQSYFFSMRNGGGRTEIQAFPYVHKMFHTSRASVDPYLALPYGFSFGSGGSVPVWQLAMGTYLKTSEHFGWNTELGLNLKNSDTYFAFGINYRD